jgi:hypothetical protein
LPPKTIGEQRAAFPFMADMKSLSSDIGRDQVVPDIGSD